MNFNIHDLIYFKISGVNRKYLDYLSKEYSFFKTDEPIEPDIEVVITDAIEPNGNCRLVDDKYFIKNSYLYCRDRYKVARWSLSIDGLEDKTVVRFRGGIWGRHVLKEFILDPLIGFKLAGKDFCTLHASAIAVNDKGFIFVGEPKSGKTASVLSLSVNDNVFLSDEIALLSKDGVVYGFPLPIRICYYRLKGSAFIYHNMTLGQRLEARIKHFAHIMSLGYAVFPQDIGARSLFKRIGGIYPLCCLVLLTKTEGKEVTLEEITDKGELVERLVLINEQQFPYWFRYVKAYSSVYPSSQIATYSQVMRGQLSRALEKVPCYEIKTPRQFFESQSEKFQQVVQTLERTI